MEITKKNSTAEKPSYNEYVVKLSYGELLAIEDALTDKHDGPIADEIFQGLKWYIDRLPPPGAEEEEGEGEKGEGKGAEKGKKEKSEEGDGGSEPDPAFGADSGEDGTKSEADKLLSDPDDTPGSKAPPSLDF